MRVTLLFTILLIFQQNVFSNTTTGNCSPLIKNVKGNITIKINKCEGIPKKVLRKLEKSLKQNLEKVILIKANKKLTDTNASLVALITKEVINEWKIKYAESEKRIHFRRGKKSY